MSICEFFSIFHPSPHFPKDSIKVRFYIRFRPLLFCLQRRLQRGLGRRAVTIIVFLPCLFFSLSKKCIRGGRNSKKGEEMEREEGRKEGRKARRKVLG